MTKKKLLTCLIIFLLVGVFLVVVDYVVAWQIKSRGAAAAKIIMSNNNKTISAKQAIDKNIINWEKYTNEKYGLEFKYPAEWKLNGNKLYFKIFEYSQISKDSEGGDNPITKSEMESSKNNIDRELVKVTVIDAKKVHVYYDFDVPSASFLEEAEFFIGKDWFKLYIILDGTPDYVWAKDREKINEFLTNLDNGSVTNQRLNEQTEIFSTILSTLKFN